MPLRRIILKCLLGSLALAAVAGVLAVLLPTRDVLVRVTFTGLATAGAAGLMIALTFLLGRPVTRWAALFGLAVVMVEFVVCLALIWLETVIGSPAHEKTWLSGAFLAVTAAPALKYLVLVRMPQARLAGAAGLLSASGALGLFHVAIWAPGPTWHHSDWWEGGWTVYGYGMLFTICLIGARLAPRHLWRWAGALCAAAGAGFVAYLVFATRPYGDLRVFRDLACLSTTSGGFAALVNLALLARLRGGQHWVRLGTIGAGATTAILIDVLLIGEHTVDTDLLGRSLAASAIVTSCGALALVVLVALNRRGAIEPSTAALLELTIICPICGLKQSVRAGASACRRCGLRMEIKLEEPRCPKCDYLLYRLTSDRCPECGAGVGLLSAP